MKNLIAILAILILTSCSNDDKKEDSFNLFNSILINLKDVQGNNLLNTNNYSSNNFKIYYVNDGVVSEFYQPNLDNPKAYAVINTAVNLRMGLSLNHNDEDYPITYIKWNETDTDTIKVSYNKADNYKLLDKIWINDVLTEPTNGISGMEFIITK
jgi:hypothetical protein